MSWTTPKLGALCICSSRPCLVWHHTRCSQHKPQLFGHRLARVLLPRALYAGGRGCVTRNPHDVARGGGFARWSDITQWSEAVTAVSIALPPQHNYTAALRMTVGPYICGYCSGHVQGCQGDGCRGLSTSASLLQVLHRTTWHGHSLTFHITQRSTRAPATTTSRGAPVRLTAASRTRWGGRTCAMDTPVRATRPNQDRQVLQHPFCRD